ncbi:MAG: glycerophosphodiester phosphodiesterase [bacterium]
MGNRIKIFDNKTLNFAHRGFTASAPENSLAAFEAALQLGVDGIELDVRTCKTGEVVVFHDSTLTRMTNGRGFVKAKSLAELKRLKLNSQNSESNHQIPTLEELIELVNGRAILNVEIKTRGLPKDHIENKVVKVLRKYGIEYQTIISSFNPIVIRRLRKIDDQLITGFLIESNFRLRHSEIPLTKFSGAKAIHLEKGMARKSIINRIRELGYYCVVWSVNEPKEMQRLINLRVNGIITDKPDLLKNVKTNNNHG